MNDILDRYGELLGEVDRWFANCIGQYPKLIVCGQGCSACCRGLFDITLMDALYLKRGFDRLSPGVREPLVEKAAARLRALQAVSPGFTAPWILAQVPEDDWDDIMPEDDPERCVLLSESGVCLVYEHRPMTCRLNGIPQVDPDGTLLSDEWCTLNFTGMAPEEVESIRYPFSELFAQELLLFRELTGRILGRQLQEVDTIIPAALFFDGEMIRKIGSAV